MLEKIEIHVIKKQLITETGKHISYIINQDTFNVDMKDVLTIKKFKDNKVCSPRSDNHLTVCFIQRYMDDIFDAYNKEYSLMSKKRRKTKKQQIHFKKIKSYNSFFL